MSSEIEIKDYKHKIGDVSEYEIGKITRQQVRRYARAIEDDNPLFQDVDYAVSMGFDDLVIPPNFLPAIIDPKEGAPADELREDGLDPSRYPVDIPSKATIVGGGQSEIFNQYLTVGESITVRETFENIYAKDGSTGKLTFLEVKLEFSTSEVKCAIECERTTIIADRQ